MSEILTINTEEDVHKVDRIKVNPLPLYGEEYFMLKHKIPEYEDPLPNHLMSDLIRRMKMTMKLYGGIGLSANQCGVSERVFVIGTDQFQIACINPKVVSESANREKNNEGCLSFPGLFCKIERPDSIVVEFTAEDGQTKQMEMTGVTARCFLHELDHLNGVRMVDHVKPVALQLARQKQQKIIKKIKRTS
jgi:peptide deformylase